VILFLIISKCLDAVFKFYILLVSLMSGDIDILMAYTHIWLQ